MTQATDKLIEQLTSYMNATGDFILTQAPDVIQQMCAWGFWSNVMWGSFLTIGSIVFSMWMWVSITRAVKKRHLTKDEIAGSLAAFQIVFLVAFCYGFSYVTEAIQIKVAPKYFVIKEISKLAKG